MKARFLLKVQQASSRCIFTLSQRGSHVSQDAVLPYPDRLLATYRQWLQAYLDYYEHIGGMLPNSPSLTDGLRGRAISNGQASASPADRYSLLAQAEAALLADFHSWLRSPDLYHIRATLARASQTQQDLAQAPAELGILCTNEPKQTTSRAVNNGKQAISLQEYEYENELEQFDLSRLPWESWEINAEFAARGQICISRIPDNLRDPLPQRSSPVRWRRLRILVILGDEDGLNFQKEKRAIASLAGIADVEFADWHPNLGRIEAVKAIRSAIAAEPGWDILYFAGHSDETDLTGGELSLASDITLSIQDLAPQLRQAQKQGLQFALFNSCRGSEIAKALIQLGLGQVAIMRERIHNQVAQQFLVLFLQQLIRHENVQSALLNTCQELETNFKQTYPSAHLVPSLYCHPDAEPFSVRRFGWWQQLRCLLPSPWEAIASAALLSASLSFPLLGWNSPVQAWLLEHRMLVQGLYRQATRQMPPTNPPILLVQIDDSSLVAANVKQRYPIDRSYLAELANRAVEMKFPVVGLDYTLADARPEDAALARAVRAGADSETLFIFAADKQCFDCEWLLARVEIAAPDRSWHGDARLWTAGRLNYPIYPSLLPPAAKRTKETKEVAELPFAYLLALGDALYARSPDTWQAQYRKPPGQLVEYLFDARMEVRKSTQFFYRFGQIWLRPEFDFSLAPTRIFASISAADFLAGEPEKLRRQYPQSTVAIIPGDYEEAGDSFYAPRPLEYWNRSLEDVKGGELHAYAFHHFRHKHLVARVPDLWLILPAFLLGKATALALQYHPQRRRKGLGLVGLTVVYGLLGLQVYISGQIVLGWVLPSAAFWIYNARLFRRKPNAV